jgi:capsular polysaccharide biosynthesis protein
MNTNSADRLRHTVRRYGLLVLLTVVGAIAGGAYGALKTPTYVAQAYVVVTGQPGEPASGVNFAQAYGRIVATGPVADKAAATLGSRDDLQAVTTSTSPDTPVIEITATGTGAKHTADVANAVAQALVDVGNARTNQTRVTLSVLAPASVPAAPSSPKPPLELAVGAAAGLLLGGLTVLAGVGRTSRPAEQGIRAMPPPPVIPASATRALTYYPQTQYYGDGYNGEKIVGRAVVLPRDPR